MQKLTPYIALLALIIAIYTMASRPMGGTPPAKTETVAERVLRTGTIRCGYVVWSPLITKDLTSGQMGGLYHDIIEETARRLSLKIEWAEESMADTLLAGIAANRYDMVCFPLYANSNRAREVMFSRPIGYASIYMTVRANEKRLTGDLMQANDPQFRFATLDGEMTAIMAAKQLPKAVNHAVPQVQGFSFVLKDIADGKADFTITDPKSVADFNKTNNNALKTIGPAAVTNAIAFPLPQDPRFKDMIDTTINELILEGFVARKVTEYNYGHSLMLPIAPYQDQRP